MHKSPQSGRIPHPSLAAILFLVLLSSLWIAGGASRADVMGQAVVRAVSSLALIVALMFGKRPSIRRWMPVLLILGAAITLSLLQLIPLPPGVWQALPGREVFVEAAAASGQPQPWRPLAIVPGAAVNAAASLLIPVATMVLVAQLRDNERQWLPGFLLLLVTASTFVGLLQFSGVSLSNPLINDNSGQVSGTFANRNHEALFLALGCMLAPAWAFLTGRPQWRGPVALALVVLFALTILATGSRAGLALGIVALAIGLILVRHGIRKSLSGYPRWIYPALIAGIVGVVAILVLVSVLAGRAMSIHRVLALDPGQDMRRQDLPVVLTMIRTYFPVGSGLGGFDPIFRMHEPFSLLKTVYFNHAHNDWLEVVLETGLPGLFLLTGAVLWWGWASVRAWRMGERARHTFPKLGSAMLVLVMTASMFDYPARTPMIMAVIVVAGMWLAEHDEGRQGSALPRPGQHL